jgi:ELWxxDGT repeat protein
LIKDITPGVGASMLNRITFTPVGSLVYFVADDPTHGRELWRTDGTAAGTLRLTDHFNGFGDLDTFGTVNPLVGVESGGVFYFVDQIAGQQKLWRTDGSAAGTYRLPAALHLESISDLHDFQGAVVFNGRTQENGAELRILRPDRDLIGNGDYDQNGVVDGNDFLRWQRTVGSHDATADGDVSGAVDAGDLTVWGDHFASSMSTVTAAPFVSAKPRGDDDGAIADAVFAAGDFTALLVSADPAPRTRGYRPPAQIVQRVTWAQRI